MPKSKKKKFLLVVMIVIAVLIFLVALVLYVRMNDQRVLEGDVIPERNRQSLRDGACTDDDFTAINNSSSNALNDLQEQVLQDKVDCLLIRNEYPQAVEALEDLKNYYQQQGDVTKVVSTDNVLTSIRVYIDTPQSVEEESTNEPVAN
jgi:hypothetical protein